MPSSERERDYLWLKIIESATIQ